jgi:putative endonuclease
MGHFVYIVECCDGTLYTGYATDVVVRVREHNGEGKTVAAKKLGAKYTRSRRPVRLVYQESALSRSEAQKREAAIKRLSAAQKRSLIHAQSVVGNENTHSYTVSISEIRHTRMAKGMDRKKEVKKPKKTVKK